MDFSVVDRLLDELVKQGMPGGALSVRHNHREVYRRAVGVSCRETGQPMTGSEAVYLFSCTKPITVTAGMQLAERGLLSLDDPVAAYLPEFAAVQVRENGNLVPPRTPLLVRHLFTMSGGLDYDMEAAPLRDLLARRGVAVTTREFAAAVAKKPLLFHPGERFQYSLSHDVLGAVIEQAAGVPFGEWLAREIFEPLGMAHTGFAFAHPTRPAPAAQYECLQDSGDVVPIGWEHPYRLGNRFESGGAGLISTLDDYALFADALACGGVGATGHRLLSAESIDRLRENQLGGFVKSTDFSCAAGPGYGYGLGVRTLIDKSNGQRSPLGEFGWDGADGAFLIVDPVNRLSLSFVQHVRNWPRLLGTFYAPIRDAVYDSLGL